MADREGQRALDDLLDAWSFNVMLECSATLPDDGKIVLGGDVLSIHDLNTLLQAVVGLRDAVKNASGFLDTPVRRRRYGADPFYMDTLASIRTAAERFQEQSS